eukprot:scaffold4468_cov129-Cylindrotheca_fusiformis.AAC.6
MSKHQWYSLYYNKVYASNSLNPFHRHLEWFSVKSAIPHSTEDGYVWSDGTTTPSTCQASNVLLVVYDMEAC